MEPTLTYFIQRKSGGPIKIGKALNPVKRLRSLQTSHDEALVLLGTIESDIEATLHDRFKHLRLKGEWFRPEIELVEFICATASISSENRRRLKRQRPILIEEARDLDTPLEEKYCETVFDVDEEDEFAIIEFLEGYAPEATCGDMDDDDKCDCDYHSWSRAVQNIAECDVVKRVGINEDQRIMFLALAPINCARREFQIEHTLTNAAWDLDICGWSLHGHGFNTAQHKDIDIDFLMFSIERRQLRPNEPEVSLEELRKVVEALNPLSAN